MKKPWNRDTLHRIDTSQLPEQPIMTDKDLIGYCEIHCHSERCMFNSDQINRMITLAGNPDEFVSEVPADRWYSIGPDQMLPLVQAARTLNNVVKRLDS